MSQVMFAKATEAMTRDDVVERLLDRLSWLSECVAYFNAFGTIMSDDVIVPLPYRVPKIVGTLSKVPRISPHDDGRWKTV